MVAIRHFSAESRREVPDGLDERLRPFVTGAYVLADQLWPVFDMSRLAADSRFRVAGG